MLPYFVWHDFDDVIDELRPSRLSVRRATGSRRTSSSASRWPASVAARGDSPRAAAGARAVARARRGGRGRRHRRATSIRRVERLQVQVTGLHRRSLRRHLQRPRRCRCSRPGRNGEYVAGVRYRAWQPPSCLHPTIPVHAPLTFDLVDTWMERSLGGCQYHVMHPGGRNYEQFPVNSYEAESRRLARFFAARPHAGRDRRCRRPRAAASSRTRWTCAPDDLTRDADASTRRPSRGATLGALAAGYARPAGHFDELLRRRRRAAARTGRRSRRDAATSAADTSRSAQARSRAADPRERRHLQRLRDRRRPGAAVGARRRCRFIVPAAEWARARARPAPARAAAERDRRRPLRPADAAARRPDAAGAGLRASRLPARRATASGRPAASFLHLRRVRSGARRPTAAGASSARARRRRRAPATRSRTARSSRALFPDAFRELRVQPLAPFFHDAAGHAAGAGAPSTATTPHVVLLTPGPLQRDLLRARLPRAVTRLPAGRGRRPDGARRPRVPEDRLRPAAACTRSSAASTTTTAIRSSCAPIRRSACPASCRRGAPGTCSSPTRSARACSSRRRCSAFLPADLRAAARRAARDAGARDLVVRRRRGARRRRGRRSRTASSSRRSPTRRWSRCSVGDLDADGRARVGRAPRRRRPTRTSSRSTCRCRTRRSGTTGALESRALMLRVFLARRRPRRLPRDAGRAVAHRRRRSPRSCRASAAAAARTPGCCRTPRRAARAASSAGDAPRERASRRARRRRAAPPSTCSGWAATRSAARTARGCCARCSAG